ncbi:MAG: TolC family protein [Bacteroidales bacterium]|nr:TolC family protein [Bacteroidales bacterium]MCD8394859.1 TolC family protein [Bacteroidales bacterium]
MKFNHIAAVVAASIMMSGLSSCHIYQKFEMPEDDSLTKEYVEARDAAVDSAAFGNLQWQQVFTDPVLVDLINRALENNVNYQNAKLNIDVAQAQLKGAKLAYFPSLSLGPNGAGVNYHTQYGATGWSWTYSIPATATWEVDIFAKLLNSKRSAKAALLKSEAYEQAVRSQLIGTVANCYYALVNIEAQLKLARETAVLWAQSVQTMKDLKEAGRLKETAVVQSEANYYSILASITDLEISKDQLMNTMSLLVEAMPTQFAVAPEAELDAPEILREAIPMRELAARPDVRAAEQDLAVAYYATNSARCNFYPTLAITAQGGFTNLLGSIIQNPGDWFIQLAASLTVPIFSRGQNIAQLEAAKAQQKQALNTFEYTLMSAAAEVSDCMTVYEKSAEKEVWLVKQVESLEKSVDYTQELLSIGDTGTTYLEVLTAQQSLLSAQMSLLSTRLDRAQSVISLYQALGGGR